MGVRIRPADTDWNWRSRSSRCSTTRSGVCTAQSTHRRARGDGSGSISGCSYCWAGQRASHSLRKGLLPRRHTDRQWGRFGGRLGSKGNLKGGFLPEGGEKDRQTDRRVRWSIGGRGEVGTKDGSFWGPDRLRGVSVHCVVVEGSGGERRPSPPRGG